MDVNDAFKHACRFIFGQEIGSLEDYKTYLQEARIGHTVRSFLSGQPTFVTSTAYPASARFFDYRREYADAQTLLAKPVDINRIKDIDSLLEAVQEKCIYAGGKVLGQSSYVEDSDNVIDSEHVIGSSMITQSRYAAYSYMLRKNEYTFASTSSGDSSWIIRCFYNNSLQRCFECSGSVSSHDCYFCYGVFNCHDCLFTFNGRGQSYSIANVSLEKSKYLELKSKLMGEIIEQLMRYKRLNFSIINMPQLQEGSPWKK